MQQKSLCAIHKEPYSLIDVTNQTLLCAKCGLKRANNNNQILKIVEFVQKLHRLNSQNQKACRNVLVQCLLQELKYFQIIDMSLEAIKELEIVQLKIKEINRQSIQLFDIYDFTSLNIQRFFKATRINGIKYSLEDIQSNYDSRISYELQNVSLFSQILLDEMDEQPPQLEKVEQLKKNISENKCSSQLTKFFSDFQRRIHQYDIRLPNPLKNQPYCDTVVYKEVVDLQINIEKLLDNSIEELKECIFLLHKNMNYLMMRLCYQIILIQFNFQILQLLLTRIQYYSRKQSQKKNQRIQKWKLIEDNQNRRHLNWHKNVLLFLIFFFKGVQNFIEGNYIHAMLKIISALELNKENSQYFYLQSMCFIKYENFIEALQAIDQAIRIQKVPHYFYIKGKILCYQGFKKSALKQLQTCTQLNDQIEGCYLLKAQLYESFGQKNQALINYQQVLRINQSNQLAHLGLQELQQ